MPALDPAFGLDPATAIPVLGISRSFPGAVRRTGREHRVGESVVSRLRWAKARTGEVSRAGRRSLDHAARRTHAISRGDRSGRRAAGAGRVHGEARLRLDPGPVVAGAGARWGGERRVAHPLQSLTLPAWRAEAAVVVDTSGAIVYANPALEQFSPSAGSVVDPPPVPAPSTRRGSHRRGAHAASARRRTTWRCSAAATRCASPSPRPHCAEVGKEAGRVRRATPARDARASSARRQLEHRCAPWLTCARRWWRYQTRGCSTTTSRSC
jgi:hypothetical protein